MFGVSGRFPPKYAGLVMTGQALGGVLPAVATIVLTTADVNPSVLGPCCFAFVLVFVAMAIVAYKVRKWGLQRSKWSIEVK